MFCFIGWLALLGANYPGWLRAGWLRASQQQPVGHKSPTCRMIRLEDTTEYVRVSRGYVRFSYNPSCLTCFFNRNSILAYFFYEANVTFLLEISSASHGKTQDKLKPRNSRPIRTRQQHFQRLSKSFAGNGTNFNLCVCCLFGITIAYLAFQTRRG